MNEPSPTSGANDFARNREAETASGTALDSRLDALERLISSAAGTASRAELRRSLIELIAAGEVTDVRGEFDLLMTAAEHSGVRTHSARLALSELDSFLRRGICLATYVTGGESEWVVVLESRGRKLRVQGRGPAEWISTTQLARRWKLDSVNTPLRWLAPERVLGVDGTAASREEAEHHAEQGHESGGHGHGHGHHSVSPLVRLWSLLRVEKRDILIVAVFAAVVSVLNLASPLAVEALVNTVSFGRLVQPLLVLSSILLIFLGFSAALKALQQYIAELIQQRLFVRIVAELAHRLPRVERRELDGKHPAELVNRFFDVMTIQKSAALLVLDGIAIALKTAIGMVVLAFYHPLLIGFDLFLLGTLAFLIVGLGRGAVRTAIDESRAKYAVAAWLEELAQFQSTFKSHGGQRLAIERADSLAARYITTRRSHFRVLMRQVAFALGMQAVIGSVLLAIGGWLVLEGSISLGQLVAAEMIVAVIVDTFAKLDKHAESLYDLLAAVDKVGHLLDLSVERQTGDAAPRETRGMALRIDQVTAVGEQPFATLAPTSLEVAAGEFVTLQGGADSGPSLLLDLLFGARTAHSGFLTADLADLRTINLASYRRQVALLRGIETFSGSIAENVHLDRDGVDSQRVRESLAAVGLWEDILRLPDGILTHLHPSGCVLSDDQLRRLMLARAIAGQPRLLLIDRLLDGLPDQQLPLVLDALQQLQPLTTIVLVTGREELRLAGRSVDLPEGDPEHRSHLTKDVMHAA